MSDMNDDRLLGLNSSAISLGKNALTTVSICYGITSSLIGLGAFNSNVDFIFWPIWLVTSLGMQREVILIKQSNLEMSVFSRHFRNQVFLGGFLLLGLVLSQIK